MSRHRLRDYRGREESLARAAFGAGLALAGGLLAVLALYLWGVR